MSFTVTPDELLSTFGLSGVVYFPHPNEGRTVPHESNGPAFA